MKKIMVFISLFFLTAYNLYALNLNANEILEIIEDRGIKYEETIDILNIIKDEEFLNNYFNTGVYIHNDANDDSDACPCCKTPLRKAFKWALYITDDIQKYLIIFKCNNKNCRFCSVSIINISSTGENEIYPIFCGKISKKDFEEIQNIKNKITYKEAVDIIKDFYSNPTVTYKKTITCLDCGKMTLVEISNRNMWDNKETLFIVTCKNKKCKFFALFEDNTETHLFDCLYHGKYNELEDVLLKY